MSIHSLDDFLDSFGINFDKTGQLSPQLDKATLAQFNDMTKCLIEEYNKICPLVSEDYSQNCLDGSASLNENIADNAGLHAAYSAYQAETNYNGEDPRLNNPVMKQFTENQLFFLSYVRDFCSGPMSNDATFAEIVSGAPNPPKFRVLTALRNYPAFKSAFNCPSNSTYAPLSDQICRVWITNSSELLIKVLV